MLDQTLGYLYINLFNINLRYLTVTQASLKSIGYIKIIKDIKIPAIFLANWS